MFSEISEWYGQTAEKTISTVVSNSTPDSQTDIFYNQMFL